MSELRKQIEKNSVFMYPDKTAYMMNETVQVISVDFVLGLLANCVCIPRKQLETELEVWQGIYDDRDKADAIRWEALGKIRLLKELLDSK